MASTIRQQTVNITPVISTVTYTGGDQLGGIQTLPIGLSETLLVELENIQLTDLAAQNASITFHFFNSLPVIISTDNQPFNISAPELTSKLIISVTLPAVNYQTIALVGVGSLSLGNVNLKSSPYSPGLLYCVAVINQSATYTSTSSISIGYNVVVYDTSDSSQVTNVQLAPMGPESIKGNNLVTSGSALDLTKTQATAMLNAMTGDSGAGGLKGMVPAQAIGDGAKYLTGAGTWGAISIPASANPALSNLTAPTSLNRDLTFQGTFGLTSPDHINAVTSLTASTILSSDASKNVVSLATATYPSLTELSYVKGVTSAVQTQINTKAAIASPTFTGTVGGITAAMVGAPSGSGTSSGTNTGDNSANSLYTANPMTTAGDLILGGASGAQGRLGIGASTYVLTSNGTTAAWAAALPSQTSQANKVLATDGTTSSWQYAGLGAGSLGTNNVFLGMPKPTGLTSGTQNTVVAAGNTGNQLTTGSSNVLLGFQMYSGLANLTGAVGIGVGGALGAHYQTVIGGSASGSTTGGVSVGSAADHGSGDVAIGYNSASGAAASIAIGSSAKTGSGGSSIVIGSSSGKAACSGANNTVVGADSFNGAGLTTAQDNVIIGKGSGKAITTAINNILLGSAGAALTSGGSNFIAGNNGSSLITGGGNIIIGNNSTGLPPAASTSGSIILGQETQMEGNNGIAIGLYARCSQDSVAIGSSVYGGSGSNQRSVTIGMQADTYSSPYSVALGALSEGRGGNEVAVGYLAKCSVGGYNVTVGTNAGNAGSGANNTIIGALAGTTLSTGGKQTYLGSYSGKTNATGVGQVCLGYFSGAYATASDEFYLNNQDRTDTAGDKAKSLMYGTFNAAAASQTLAINAAVSTPYTLAVTGVATFTAAPIVSSVTASQILASGASKEVVSLSTATYPSLAELAYVKGVTSAIQTQLSAAALPSQTSQADKVLVTDGTTSSWQYAGLGSGGFGTGNVFLGTPKPAGLSGATNSIYIGVNCGDSLTTGTFNTAIGNESLRYNLTGVSNSALGRYTLQNTTGSYNTAIGGGALKTNTSGANNSALGFQALYNNVTGTGNVAIGYYAGRYATASDEFYLNNQNRTDTAGDKASSLMYGQFNATASSQTLAINADLKMLTYTESVVASGVVGATATLSILSGTVQTATLTASALTTFTMPTATAGKSFTLYLKQAAATGLGTATFTGVKWATAGAPVITATAGLMDILSFVADGTNWYGSYQQGYTP